MKKSRPIKISSRWKPGHVVRVDSGIGTYEEVNPMHDNDKIQSALLARARERGSRTPVIVYLAIATAALAAVSVLV